MTLILNSIASANTANDQVETEVHRSNETVKQNERHKNTQDNVAALEKVIVTTQIIHTQFKLPILPNLNGLEASKCV